MKQLGIAALAAILLSVPATAQRTKHYNVKRKVVRTIKTPALATYFAKSVNQYPIADLHIWDYTNFSTRVYKILGDRYQNVYSNLTTETPVETDGLMYKFSLCQPGNCPANKATFYYDPKQDNIMVLLEKDGGSDRFSEKGRFYPSEELENK